MDCLVKLYNLSGQQPGKQKFHFRRVMAYEKSLVLDWVKTQFNQLWADECSMAFNQQPISCFIATMDGNIVGFACYDCTQKNFFGPMGVHDKFRTNGIGKNLLLTCLHAMKNSGYAYAIIGGCDGIEKFYINTVNAVIIEGSTPGIYSERLNM